MITINATRCHFQSVNLVALYAELIRIFDRVIIGSVATLEELVSVKESLCVIEHNLSGSIFLTIEGKDKEKNKERLTYAMRNLGMVLEMEYDDFSVAGGYTLSYRYQEIGPLNLPKRISERQLDLIKQVAARGFVCQLNDCFVNFNDEFLNYKKCFDKGEAIAEVHIHREIREVSVCVYTKYFNQNCKDILTRFKHMRFEMYCCNIYKSSWGIHKLPDGYRAYVFGFRKIKE